MSTGSKNRRWTADEIEELRQLNDDGYRYKEIAILLGRTFNSVATRMSTLGIKAHRGWTDDKSNQLRELCATDKYTYAEIAKIMGISKPAVQAQANAQKIKNRAFEVQYQKIQALNLAIVRCGNVQGRKAAMRIFNLTPKEYRSRRTTVLGKNKDSSLRVSHPWTDEDILFVLRHYGLRTARWIGKNLTPQRTSSGVLNKVCEMGLAQWDFHGLPYRDVDRLLGEGIAKNLDGIKVIKHDSYRRVIPWVMIYMGYLAKTNKDPFIWSLVVAMSTFQCALYGIDHPKNGYKVLERLRNGKERIA